MVVLGLQLHRMLRVRLTVLVMLAAAISASTDDEQHQLDLSDGCVRRCGGVDIPFPFGLTPSCALHPNFLIYCDNSSGNPIPVTGNLIVSAISVQQPQVTVLFDVTKDCYTESGEKIVTQDSSSLVCPNTMFAISTNNNFTIVGCDSFSILNFYNKDHEFGYLEIGTTCESMSRVQSGSCSLPGCDYKEIPERIQNMTVKPYSFNFHNDTRHFNNCTYAFVVEQNQFNFSCDYVTNFPQDTVPVALDWAIPHDICLYKPSCLCGGNSRRHELDDGSGYYCLCDQGFKGNPYLRNGCQDINECENPSLNNCSETRYCVNKQGTYTCSCPSWFKADGRKGGSGCIDQLPVIKLSIGIAVGFITVLISGTWVYMVFKKRKLIKLKVKFFQQNGGLILQQLSQQKDSKGTAKIFLEQELRKATHNYDESTIIGKGGFGTVYKGILADSQIVAIKKSKIVDQSQIEQFINEVVVLSQINHRNVVKLLGCCLETEVPLLVYEFIANGNLFEHIHDSDKASKLVWKTRLDIAAEAAGALSYLHSAASTPIIHRDVKPSNILLDNYMTAKVSDFGGSRLISLDRTELTTVVQGTLGYLDPEYLHSNQLTDKSDVYSFGVVLVELLTGRKAISFHRPEEKRNLAMHFLYSLAEGKLFEILERNMMNEENKEQLKDVAELAKRCLSLKGEDKPCMKEVAMQLEGIRKMKELPWVSTGLNLEETERLLGETSNAYEDCGNSISYNDAITLDFTGR